MAVTIIVGAQWGDEGKGRITDLLASQANLVVRFSGGDNAGHTITIGEQIFKLHLIPSGIIHPDTTCLLGAGVVINPKVMLREMSGLRERGVSVSPDRLRISRSAHIITPAHVALDKAAEAARGSNAIGTTQRGIGPAYTDKATRSGIRAHLLTDPEGLADAVKAQIEFKNKILTNVYGAEALDADAIAADYVAYAQELAPYVTDGTALLHQALADGKRVLAEGAQGTMLDIDHGTYPFVTSSSPTACGALTGMGVGPKSAERIIGVAKAFSSRVGAGPFTSEVDGDMALRLRGTGANPWDEYGTTTGRPRRVGWLDLVVLRYAANINTFTEFVLTKLDILSGLKEIPVCVAYKYKGETIQHFPSEISILEECEAVFETLPGWDEDIMGCRSYDELPENARRYIEFVGEQLNAPVNIISVGPARDHTIIR